MLSSPSPATIAVINEKGGVGKSTTTVSLGGAYARAGLATLLIDLDPQASLTRGLIGDDETDALPPSQTAAALFGDEVVPAGIVPTRFPGLSLLPGARALNPFNLPDVSQAGARLFALRDLDVSAFARVLIDCPPNLYALSWCAMAAAGYVLTPTRADPYGVQAIRFVNEAVARIRATLHPGLVQLGYVLSAHQKRSALHAAYAAGLAHDFPALVFADAVPHAAQFLESLHALAPIGYHKPRCEAARAVGRIMDEIEARITGARPVAAAA